MSEYRLEAGIRLLKEQVRSGTREESSTGEK